MNRLLSLRLFFFSLLSVFVLSACDSGGSNGGAVNNEFSLDISPTASSQIATAKAATDTTISGFSFFYSGTNPETNEDAFLIYFTGSNSAQGIQQGLFGFLGRNALRKDTGTGQFNVATNQGFNSSAFTGILFEDLSAQTGSNPYYVPQSGTINIDNSSSNEVAGSVDLTAYRLQIDTTGTTLALDSTEVTITGQFGAKNMGQFVAPVNP